MADAQPVLPPVRDFAQVPCGPGGRPLLLAYAYGRHVTVVTVEAAEKWYGLILARRDVSGWLAGVHEFPDEGRYEVLGSPYVDHVPNPAHVLVWAKRMGYHLDTRALEVMLGRWVLDADGDVAPVQAVLAADDEVPA